MPGRIIRRRFLAIATLLICVVPVIASADSVGILSYSDLISAPFSRVFTLPAFDAA
jgi:hypothetical protein